MISHSYMLVSILSNIYICIMRHIHQLPATHPWWIKKEPLFLKYCLVYKKIVEEFCKAFSITYVKTNVLIYHIHCLVLFILKQSIAVFLVCSIRMLHLWLRVCSFEGSITDFVLGMSDNFGQIFTHVYSTKQFSWYSSEHCMVQDRHEIVFGMKTLCKVFTSTLVTQFGSTYIFIIQWSTHHPYIFKKTRNNI